MAFKTDHIKEEKAALKNIGDAGDAIALDDAAASGCLIFKLSVGTVIRDGW